MPRARRCPPLADGRRSLPMGRGRPRRAGRNHEGTPWAAGASEGAGRAQAGGASGRGVLSKQPGGMAESPTDHTMGAGA